MIMIITFNSLTLCLNNICVLEGYPHNKLSLYFLYIIVNHGQKSVTVSGLEWGKAVL